MRIKSVFRSDIRCRGASRRLADWLDHGATVAPLGARRRTQRRSSGRKAGSQVAGPLDRLGRYGRETGDLSCSSLTRRLTAHSAPIHRAAQNASVTRHLGNARTEDGAMNRDRRFPASRRARPCARVGQARPATRDPEAHVARAANDWSARRSCRPAFTGDGCWVGECVRQAEHRPEQDSPVVESGDGGTRPQRFFRAPSVHAFRTPPVIAGVLCRAADVAASHRTPEFTCVE
jgi:hypothetical protein